MNFNKNNNEMSINNNGMNIEEAMDIYAYGNELATNKKEDYINFLDSTKTITTTLEKLLGAECDFDEIENIHQEIYDLRADLGKVLSWLLPVLQENDETRLDEDDLERLFEVEDGYFGDEHARDPIKAARMSNNPLGRTVREGIYSSFSKKLKCGKKKCLGHCDATEYVDYPVPDDFYCQFLERPLGALREDIRSTDDKIKQYEEGIIPSLISKTQECQCLDDDFKKYCLELIDNFKKLADLAEIRYMKLTYCPELYEVFQDVINQIQAVFVPFVDGIALPSKQSLGKTESIKTDKKNVGMSLNEAQLLMYYWWIRIDIFLNSQRYSWDFVDTFLG